MSRIDGIEIGATLGANTFTGTQQMPAIKITGGTPGAGKLLQSDADGDGTWETVASAMSAASQAQMEAATSNAVAGTPLSTNWHPGVAKTWITCGVAGDILASWNITSITDTGTGILTVTIATDFSSVNYVAVTGTGSATMSMEIAPATKAAGSFVANTYNASYAAVDPSRWNIACFGDQ